ncbi:uncharacterized protein LOC135398770 [Ornithodoros turicata]|uniref:uncharacterized protein LOC135398770 n=1 Tax=Ornithodoros turicata TaxID=34597 RepID=UPI003139C755
MRLIILTLLLLCPVGFGADDGGFSLTDLWKFLTCFRKLSDVNGVCSQKMQEYNQTSEKFVNTHDPTRDKKGVCCQLSNLMDCYTANIRQNCGDDASKYVIHYVESITRAKVREACLEFDGKVCRSGATSTSSLSLFLLIVSVLFVIM